MQESKNVPLSSPVLLAFYGSWLADHHTKERTRHGLCVCLDSFIWDEMWDRSFNEEHHRQLCAISDATLKEMKKQFRCAGLSVSVPFNVNYEDYVREHNHSRAHENPLRVQWVKDRIEDCLNNYEDVLCEQNKSR